MFALLILDSAVNVGAVVFCNLMKIKMTEQLTETIGKFVIYDEEEGLSPGQRGRLRNEIFLSWLDITNWQPEEDIDGSDEDIDRSDENMQPLPDNQKFEEIAENLGGITYFEGKYIQNGFSKLPYKEQMSHLREVDREITTSVLEKEALNIDHAQAIIEIHINKIRKKSIPYMNPPTN